MAKQAMEMPLQFVPLAYGIAMQELEAWMLADEKAFLSIIGGRLRRKKWLTHPEKIDDPKAHIRDLIKDSTGDFRYLFSDYVEQLAETIDLETLKQCCPRFADFAGRLLEVIDTLIKQHGPTP